MADEADVCDQFALTIMRLPIDHFSRIQCHRLASGLSRE